MSGLILGDDTRLLPGDIACFNLNTCEVSFKRGEQQLLFPGIVSGFSFGDTFNLIYQRHVGSIMALIGEIHGLKVEPFGHEPGIQYYRFVQP